MTCRDCQRATDPQEIRCFDCWITWKRTVQVAQEGEYCWPACGYYTHPRTGARIFPTYEAPATMSWSGQHRAPAANAIGAN